ncbi:histidine kinase [Hoyosella subflava]|uniref:Putative two-component histidine kinase n=1 Tax=Hoyosella subflava (strain DSM 45089 / JCM 17490 / NBRC 109087 / DQS3-9A1) TaxID=443218 RepID=F6EN16_HOYSD|nr:histidine kinase [Hoyosella subflava]AEF39333.1 Putative two-component histidine kinase [Hoyosella subflava DQS3-9A1]
MSSVAVAAGAVILAVLGVLAIAVWLRARQGFTTPTERAVHATLSTAGEAAKVLRRGLTAESAAESAPILSLLVGSQGMAICGADGEVLAWEGLGQQHRSSFSESARDVVATGRQRLIRHDDLDCHRDDCEVWAFVAQPIITGEASDLPQTAGVLTAVVTGPVSPGLVRTLAEVTRYAASQLELAELDASRERLAHAEVRALRAQISPHFIYNALTTIASFVRTDPQRARELILEFADFTRYSFRSAGEFTTLAEELQNVERYLTLEQARFGDKLSVRLQVAPEVLNVVIPFLVLQPLVENAVRHGIAGNPEGGSVAINATDSGAECVLSIEDDGIGMDPERLRSGAFDSDPHDTHIGLSNVDERLRAVFGDDYGLVVETAVGAGTRVVLRVPKFRQGVTA